MFSVATLVVMLVAAFIGEKLAARFKYKGWMRLASVSLPPVLVLIVFMWVYVEVM